MNTLLTGSSGYLGRYLMTELSVAGHAGMAVSRRPQDNLPQGWRSGVRATVLGDASGQMSGIPDLVVHLEVKQHVMRPTSEDLAAFRSVNIEGTKQWLEWCAKRAVKRFVFFSSIKAVQMASTSQLDESATGPNDSPYGESKWEAEEAVRRWVQAGPGRAALILRPAVVYGPGNAANVGAMVRGIAAGRFFLVGANHNVKSVVSVRNLSAATVHLMGSMAAGRCEIFNVTDEESYSVRELDRLIRRLLGKSGSSPALPVPLARMLARSGDAFHQLTGRTFPINSSRLAALLESTHFSCAKLLRSGFKHPETTEQGFGEMIAPGVGTDWRRWD